MASTLGRLHVHLDSVLSELTLDRDEIDSLAGFLYEDMGEWVKSRAEVWKEKCDSEKARNPAPRAKKVVL